MLSPNLWQHQWRFFSPEADANSWTCSLTTSKEFLKQIIVCGLECEFNQRGKGPHSNLNLETNLQYWTFHCCLKTQLNHPALSSFSISAVAFILQWTFMTASARFARRNVCLLSSHFSLKCYPQCYHSGVLFLFICL